MRVQSRQLVDSLLSELGVERDVIHGTGCYTLAPTAPKVSVVAIDGVLDAEKPAVASALVHSLAQIRPSCWPTPNFPYFGEKPLSSEEWSSFNLPPLTDEPLEWEASDLPLV